MASSSGGSKQKKGLRNLLKETLHVRSRSKSPSQPPDVSQQPSSSSGPSADLPTSAQPGTSPLRENLPSDVGGSVVRPNITPSLAAKQALHTETPNVAWTQLRVCLQVLRDSSATLHPLPSVIETLLSCLGRLENIVKKWPDYEGLASSLVSLGESIVQHTRVTEDIHIPNAVFSLVFSIRQQVVNLSAALGNESDPGSEGADSSTIRECYESIQSLFRQLEVNLRDGGWINSNKETTSSLLSGLGFSEKLRYDSGTWTNIRRTCTEGTRTGVLAQLEDWMNDPAAASVCWMSGTEGTGKTTIARTLCERLDYRKLLAASLFCTHTSPELRDTTWIATSIAYQLAQYSAPFQRALCEVLTEDPGVMSGGGSERFRRIVRAPLAKANDAMPKNRVVVIDGLDECEACNGSDFVRNFLENGPLKFLVTSRRKAEGIVGDNQRFAPKDLDDIDPSTVRSDIERYFKAELESLALTTAQLEGLADRTNLLFLCATILVRFINLGDSRSTSHDRLQLILSMTHESTRKHAYIDMVYAAILRSVLSNGEADNTRAVLWTVLFAQEAIGVETIRRLGGMDNPEQVRVGLQPLSAVLCYSEGGELVSALHSSFPEFMLDSERSGLFFYDIANHSRLIVERCFDVMKAELRFNICGLESSFVLDREVENIESRIKENISPTLLYACRYWANHLELAANCDRLLQELELFLSTRLLFWMEVLSLKREMRQGVVALMKTIRWLKLMNSTKSELKLLVEDSRDFVTRYAANPVCQSTPHIYISSLPLCSRVSQVHMRYSKLTGGLLDIEHNLTDSERPAALAIWTTDLRHFPVDCSSDGNQIIIGGSEGTVNIRDVHTGRPIVGPFRCHPFSVVSVAFSPDGSRFATGSGDETVRVWKAVDGTPITDPLLGHTGSVISVVFSPDGTLVASGALGSTVRVWDANNGTMIIGPLAAGDDYFNPLAFSPDGSRIATISSQDTILLWDITAASSPTAELEGHSLAITALVFSPDGSRLFSSALDGLIRFWSVSDRTLVTEIDCCAHIQTLGDPKNYPRIQYSMMSLAVSPNGRRLASGSYDHDVRVWDTEDGSLVAGPFPGHSREVESVAYSPDGTRVISCAGDKTIRTWSIREGPLFSAHDSQMFEITSITFSLSGSRIYTTSPRGVSLWDAGDGSLLANVTSGRAHSTCSLPISHDGTHIAVFLQDYSVEVLSTKDRSRVAGPFRGHSGLVTCAVFSFGGEHLITGSKDRTVRMWSLREGRLASGPFMGHTKAVMQVSISHDGSRLASYSLDESIRVWDVGGSVMKVELGALGYSSGLADSGGQSGVPGGWTKREDGWVTNGEGLLLFWVPSDFPCKVTPETKLAITRFGSFSIPEHKLLLGHAWDQCYIST